MNSTVDVLQLPAIFRAAILILGLALALAPYVSGDFGAFKVPKFSDRRKKSLRVLGPLALSLTLFLFIPLWPAEGLSSPGVDYSQSEIRALSYTRAIVNLRDDYESCDTHRKSCQIVLEGAPRYAELMMLLDDDELDPAHQLMKYEYITVASMFMAAVQPDVAKMLAVCDQGISSGEHFLRLSENVDKRFNESAYHRRASEWIREDDGLNRTRYYLAMLYSTKGSALDESTYRRSALDHLERVSSSYKQEWPPEEEPRLHWALVAPKGE